MRACPEEQLAHQNNSVDRGVAKVHWMDGIFLQSETFEQWTLQYGTENKTCSSAVGIIPPIITNKIYSFTD